jgi:perosamine synthetase
MKVTGTLSKKEMPTTLAPMEDRILAAIRAVLPDSARTYALHEPEFSGKEWEYVKDCIETRMVSSVGSYVDRFERMLENYTGA